jgi:hypothetical protein
MISETPRDTVQINKLALVALAAGATLVGSSPFTLLYSRWWLPCFLVLFALLAGAGAVRGAASRATASPRPLELLMAGASAAADSAVGALFGLLFYLCAYGVGWFAQWVAARFDTTLDIALDLANYFGIASTTVIVAVLAPDMVRRLVNQAYPQAAGLRSAFYSIATFRRPRAWGQLAAVVLLPVAFRAGVGVLHFQAKPAIAFLMYLLLTALLLVVTAPLQSLGETSNLAKEPRSAITAVIAMFQAAGYTVVAAPRTGRDEIDPLLAHTPQFVAQSVRQAFAVEVRIAGSSGGNEHDEVAATASELTSAAWALERYFRQSQGAAALPVTPLMLFVGEDSPAAAKLQEKSRGYLRILQIDDGTVQSFSAPGDEEARRQLARRSLAGLDPDPVLAARPSPPTVRGRMA